MRIAKGLVVAAFLLTIPACATLSGAANTSAFRDDENKCRGDLEACIERCKTGDRGSCDVRDVFAAEEDPAFMALRKARGLPPLDADQLATLKADMTRLCESGIRRACDALPRVDARLAAIPPTPAVSNAPAPPPAAKSALRERADLLLARVEGDPNVHASLKRHLDQAVSLESKADPVSQRLLQNMFQIAEEQVVQTEKNLANKQKVEQDKADHAESERQIGECVKDLAKCKAACEQGGECFPYYAGLVAKGNPKQVLEGKEALDNLCSSAMTPQPRHGAKLACDHANDWEYRASSCIKDGLAFCQTLCNTSAGFHLACYAAAQDMMSDKNVTGALKFLEKACSPSSDVYGTSEACHSLGMRYFEGSGVPKDRAQSLKFMKLACSASKAELQVIVSDKSNTGLTREAAAGRHNTYCGEVFGLQCVAKAVRHPARDAACVLGRRQNLAYQNADPQCLNAMGNMGCYERPGLYCCPPGM